jgi:CheR methyltransferase, SAM binding domain
MEPVMLRVYDDGKKGATAFFRNRPFLDTLLEVLHQLQRPKLRIFVHAASIGAEPYSLALRHLHRHPAAFDLQIVASDASKGFLDVARAGRYPPQLLPGLTDEERSWFEQSPGELQVPDAAKMMVQFLPPMNLVCDRPEGRFDAVLIMNALTYVSTAEQHAAIALAAEYTDVLALTAFHPDNIRADLEHVGFRPVMENHAAIHQAWGDRLTTRPIDPASPEYSWRLPPYGTDNPDYAYRFGSIFQRSGNP